METIEFHLDGISPELENKLRERVSAGKKPADVAFHINKMLLADFMRKNSIDLIVVEYSGSGDSGGVDAVTFCKGEKQIDAPQGRIQLVFVERRYQKDGDTVKFTTFNTSTDGAFEMMTDEVLDLCGHGGWENNGGGSGEARFTLANPQDKAVAVQITHNTYVTDVLTDEYQL